MLPLARMVYGEVGQSYVALARPEGATLVGKFTNVLKFTVKEIDPTTGPLPAVRLQAFVAIMLSLDKLPHPQHLICLH